MNPPEILVKLPQCSLALKRKDRPRTELPLGSGVPDWIEELAYLTNILILDPTYLLNVGSALGDVFERIACKLEFVFLVF